MIIYGLNPVLEALRARRATIVRVSSREDERVGLVRRLAEAQGVPVRSVPATELDRLTRGIYRSTPHRVVNTSKRNRLSLPFFFDPNFAATISPIEGLEHRGPDDSHERWDHASLHEFSGTYGDYLLGKVSKVFPQLRKEVL